MRCVHCFLMAGILLDPAFAGAQNASAFSGLWRQDIADSSPKSKSRIPKQLNIKLEGDTLTVTMMGLGKVHQVDMTYQLGGPELTYTGLDGDEFHIKARREGDSLVFDGNEHERGSEHAVHETWTLQNKSEAQLLIDAKNAKDPDEPAQIRSEYQRVKQ